MSNNSGGKLDYKVVLLGDSGVGKSALVMWYTEKVFNPSEVATIGVSTYRKTFTFDDTKVTLTIWDTAGQERFASIGTIHCRNADAVVMCYDITKKRSFENVDKWLSMGSLPDNALVVLVGCKSDMNNLRLVTASMGEAKAESARPGGVQFFETSVVKNSGVDEVFEFISDQLIFQKKSKEENVDLNQIPPAPGGRCC